MSTDGSVPLCTLLAQTTQQSFPVGLLIAIIALIIMSGFFSSTETAYSCASRIKLRTLAAGGDKRAKKVLDLAETNYDKFISTVLVGNNIVNLNSRCKHLGIRIYCGYHSCRFDFWRDYA